MSDTSGYVIGLDAGGTKSHLAIYDLEGNKIAFSSWGTLNHELMPGSYNQFEQETRKFVNQALEDCGAGWEDIRYATIGAAGVDTPEQYKAISQRLKTIGFTQFTLCNDAFLGVMAGVHTGAGICCINGTGSTIAGIDHQGRMFQVGGAGYITNDRGGGSYIGESAVRAVYRHLFQKGEPTVLADMMFQYLGIDSKYDFVQELSRRESQGERIRGNLNRLVFQAVTKGDNVAEDILLRVARYYAGSIGGLMDELRFSPKLELEVVLAGSVFTKGEHPLLLDSLQQIVTHTHPQYRFLFRLLETPPVSGGVKHSLRTVLGHNEYFHKVDLPLQNIR